MNKITVETVHGPKLTKAERALARENVIAILPGLTVVDYLPINSSPETTQTTTVYEHIAE